MGGDFENGQRHGALLAFFVLTEVVADGDRNLLDRLFADAGYFSQLFGGHVGDCFDGGDAGCDELLEDLVSPSSVTCSIGVVGSAGHGLHLLLDLLALLFFGFDVDLPLEELGGETDVLALLADGER